MVAGAVVWHWLPTGIGSPAMFRLVIFNVTRNVAVTVLSLRLAVPVAVPSWMNSVVAETGISPNSLKETVAGGSVSVAVTAEVLGSTVLLSVPGPSVTVDPSALR